MEMDPHVRHDVDLHPSHQRRLAAAVMRRQVSLSIRVAAVFLIMLLGLPLVNYFLPDLANAPFMGFTLTWFFLAILFYPITWLLSWWFIRQSNRIEAEIAATMHHEHAHTEGKH